MGMGRKLLRSAATILFFCFVLLPARAHGDITVFPSARTALSNIRDQVSCVAIAVPTHIPNPPNVTVVAILQPPLNMPPIVQRASIFQAAVSTNDTAQTRQPRRSDAAIVIAPGETKMAEFGDGTAVASVKGATSIAEAIEVIAANLLGPVAAGTPVTSNENFNLPENEEDELLATNEPESFELSDLGTLFAAGRGAKLKNSDLPKLRRPAGEAPYTTAQLDQIAAQYFTALRLAGSSLMGRGPVYPTWAIAFSTKKSNLFHNAMIEQLAFYARSPKSKSRDIQMRDLLRYFKNPIMRDINQWLAFMTARIRTSKPNVGIDF